MSSRCLGSAQQVAFTVARHGPVFDLRRSLAARHGVVDAPAVGALLRVVPRSPHGPVRRRCYRSNEMLPAGTMRSRQTVRSFVR